MTLSVASMVLGQTGFYNGHSTLEIKDIHIADLRQLLKDLSKESGSSNLFYAKLYDEEEGYSCSIYEEGALRYFEHGPDKIWLGIENVRYED